MIVVETDLLTDSNDTDWLLCAKLPGVFAIKFCDIVALLRNLVHKFSLACTEIDSTYGRCLHQMGCLHPEKKWENEIHYSR